MNINVVNIDKEINWNLYKGKDTNQGRQSYEGFWKELIESKYKMTGEYINSSIKVELICNKGHKWEVSPNSFKRGSRCKICAGLDSKTSELDFMRKLKEVNYKLVGEYINNSTKVEVICNKKHTYKVSPNSFKRGCRCPECWREGIIKRTKIDFLKCLKEAKYKLIGNYTDTSTKIKLMCDKGHIYSTDPHNFKRGRRCPICAGLDSKTSELDFIRKLKKEGYEMIGKYTNAMDKLEVVCNKGHKYKVRPNHFKNGSRCPHCKVNSKGELITKKIFKEAGIKIESQKEFDGMIDERNLTYDFYIPSANVAIEIQGEQHYKPIEFFGGEKQFNKQKKHDEIKRNYSKANGIELIEIPYYGRKYNIRYVEKEVKKIIEKIKKYEYIEYKNYNN